MQEMGNWPCKTTRDWTSEEMLHYLFNEPNTSSVSPYKRFNNKENDYSALEDFIGEIPHDLAIVEIERSRNQIRVCGIETRFVCKTDSAKRGLCLGMFVEYFQGPSTLNQEQILLIKLRLDSESKTDEVKKYSFSDFIPEKEYLKSFLSGWVSTPDNSPMWNGIEPSYEVNKGSKLSTTVFETIDETHGMRSRSNVSLHGSTGQSQVMKLKGNDDDKNSVEDPLVSTEEPPKPLPSDHLDTDMSYQTPTTKTQSKRSKRKSKSKTSGNGKLQVVNTENGPVKLYSVLNNVDESEETGEIDFYNDVEDLNHQDVVTIPEQLSVGKKIKENPYGRGIQGRNNSCYMDALLFSWFYRTDLFDQVLFNPNPKDSDLAKQLRKHLKTNVADPLRINQFCPAGKVQKLRNCLATVNSRVRGEMMDAEELLYLILDEVLQAEGFISYGESKEFMHLLTISQKMYTGRLSITVQECLKNSLQIWGDLKFTSVPYPALFLALPRSDGNLVHFEAVIPNRSLDLTDLISISDDDQGGGTCSSGSCEQLGIWECVHCLEQGHEFIVCESCSSNESFLRELHEKNSQHSEPAKLRSRKWMDLNSVICIRSAHYVAFVKSRSENRGSPEWLFFDSMSSFNIKSAPGMDTFLECMEQDHELSLSQPCDDSSSRLLRRILTDGHICIYEPRLKLQE